MRVLKAFLWVVIAVCLANIFWIVAGRPHMTAQEAQTLREEYAPQMEIYAAAASRWPGVRRVSSYLVNILRGYCVRMR